MMLLSEGLVKQSKLYRSVLLDCYQDCLNENWFSLAEQKEGFWAYDIFPQIKGKWYFYTPVNNLCLKQFQLQFRSFLTP